MSEARDDKATLERVQDLHKQIDAAGASQRAATRDLAKAKRANTRVDKAVKRAIRNRKK